MKNTFKTVITLALVFVLCVALLPAQKAKADEKDMGNASMTKPATLTKFINYCSKNFPANRNMLIFWDHGGGSVSGYGYDEKNPSAGSMDLAEIDLALSLIFKSAKTSSFIEHWIRRCLLSMKGAKAFLSWLKIRGSISLSLS